MNDDLSLALEPLGFTELEALVYADLVRRPGQTGYALAKRLGKGQPGVYAALTGLEAKRAVHRTDAASRTYAPFPPRELIERARDEQAARLTRAEAALARLTPEDPDASSLTRIDDPDQIHARALRIIEGATDTLLFEFTPPYAPVLGPALAAAAARGVTVAGMVMREEDAVPGARNVVSPRSTAIVETWPFAVLILVADARQSLIAGVGETSSQALWSDSLFLSVVLNNAIASDILLQERESTTWVGPNIALLGRHPSGFKALMGWDRP